MTGKPAMLLTIGAMLYLYFNSWFAHFLFLYLLDQIIEYTVLMNLSWLYTGLNLFMQDKKILNQFAAKISKAKILYDSTSANCQKLRRQAAQLQRQYEILRSQRQAAENLQKNLKQQLQQTKDMNKDQNERFQKQTKHLNELKSNKKQLKRQKDAIQNQLLKNTLSLQQLIQQRQKLQNQAKNLSDRLEGVTAEKEVLIQQYNKTNAAIEKYNKNIQDLKAEIKDMRSVITNNTVPVVAITENSSRIN